MLTASTRSDIEFADLLDKISSTNASVATCKAALKTGEERIRQRFSSCEFAWLAIGARTELVDTILTHCWQQLDCCDNYSLVAVGGYGRAELHPHSDVDLMILVEGELDSAQQTSVSKFVTKLWDFGLEISHSVRSVAQCIEEAANDVTVMTNVMESRLLAGNDSLYQAMKQGTAPEYIWPAHAFFKAKRLEQKNRHFRFQDTSYRLEPNVKESPGGIRDIHTLRWIALRYFDSSDFHILVERGFLNSEELTTLRNGEDLLCKTRFVLHNLSGRREDRLLFDHQRDLANAFGFTIDENNYSIEQFMQGYYRTVMALERLNEMLLQLFAEGLPEQQEKSAITTINTRFQIRNKHIEVTDKNVFTAHPPALLEIFYLISLHPAIAGVSANTIRLIRRHLYLIDDDFRKTPEPQELFIKILAKSDGVTHQLRRMNRYGVLAAYLPAFQKIVGRMQYDLFHIFTVDEHTLMVIRNMRRFCIDKHRDEVPHCNDVMETIERPELLFLMGLFHDIAKGRGGDHSELGARDAWAFCTAHGLSAVDAGLVQWAVENHLLMSMTIQRRDVTDHEVINAFAKRVSSKIHLDYLYLLTVADIRGTNPELWNSWKESLLQTLYHGTLKVLNRGLDNPLNKTEIIEENKQQALNLLKAQGMNKATINRCWKNMGDAYFLRYSADEISWHTAFLQHHDDNLPLVLIRQESQFNSTEIFIYCADQDHLFVQITTVLGQLQLNIISARIVTSTTNFALDRFRVLDKNNNMVTDKSQLEEIRKHLTTALSAPEKLPDIARHRQSRRLKNFNIPVSVDFDNEIAEGLTSVAVTATDRPGALAQIARSFLECGIVVHAAKIATFGEKIEDVFFVSDKNGNPVNSAARLRKLKTSLAERLNQ